jgi:PAS domain-containing protein
LFNAVLTGVLTVDDCGRITHANQAAEACSVRMGDSLRGQSIDTYINLGPYMARQTRTPPAPSP